MQFHKNPMKYKWKTHESFFQARGMNMAFSNIHSLIETHLIFMKIISWLMKNVFMAMQSWWWSKPEINGSWKSAGFHGKKIHE